MKWVREGLELGYGRRGDRFDIGIVGVEEELLLVLPADAHSPLALRNFLGEGELALQIVAEKIVLRDRLDEVETAWTSRFARSR